MAAFTNGESSATDATWVEVDTDEVTLVNGSMVNDRVATRKGARKKHNTKQLKGL